MTDSSDTQHWATFINAFTGKRILLIGDVVADHYIRGKSSRISREAPVLILKYQDETVVPGQVGNTAANIAALGGNAHLVSLVGQDARGAQLLDALEAFGVATEDVHKSTAGATLTKTRILAGGHHTARQQVIRIDDDERLTPAQEDRQALYASLEAHVGNVDAIIVSDYGYGAVDEPMWNRAVAIGREAGIPVVLDSRYNLTRWQGATLITPNEEEALQVAGLSTEVRYDISDVGRLVRERTGCTNLIITRGNEGMVLFPTEGKTVHLPIFGSDECTDVTGAGDTVVATATLALASGATPLQAMTLSNLAGALVVMKLGTATVSQQELLDKLHLIRQPITGA